MLGEAELRSRLPVAGLGIPLYCYPSIGSTNDRAEELAREGAPHGTLVIADAQTAGRGRGGRTWLTPAGSGIAMSVVLRPEDLPAQRSWGLTVLGTLAIIDGLTLVGIRAQIKWPNDVLAGGRKLGGVLAEATWAGERLDHAVVGVGVNVTPESAPADGVVDFPATCAQAAAGREVDRDALLLGILQGMGQWLPQIGSRSMLEAWDRALAYRGEEVEVEQAGGLVRGRLHGLTAGGRVVLITESNDRITVEPSAWRLRPVRDNG